MPLILAALRNRRSLRKSAWFTQPQLAYSNPGFVALMQVVSISHRYAQPRFMPAHPQLRLPRPMFKLVNLTETRRKKCYCPYRGITTQSRSLVFGSCSSVYKFHLEIDGKISIWWVSPEPVTICPPSLPTPRWKKYETSGVKKKKKKNLWTRIKMVQSLSSGARYEGEHGSKDILLSALFWSKSCAS